MVQQGLLGREDRKTSVHKKSIIHSNTPAVIECHTCCLNRTLLLAKVEAQLAEIIYNEYQNTIAQQTQKGLHDQSTATSKRLIKNVH